MNKIEVKVLQEPCAIAALSSLAANVTQKPISNMDELVKRLDRYKDKPALKTIENCQNAGHGSVLRHGSYTIAIVGASRRFLAQIRTHHVGIDFVSASLQYQNMSNEAKFVVPYAVFERCEKLDCNGPMVAYLAYCEESLKHYRDMAEDYDKDTAGYIMCQSMRNTIILTGNAQALSNLISLRSCNRNTDETKYIANLMWRELLKTTNGPDIFKMAAPACVSDYCKEGKNACSNPVIKHCVMNNLCPLNNVENVDKYIKDTWPLLETRGL